MKKKKSSFLSRVAMSLLVMLLTATTAWAADITLTSAVVINNGNKATYENKSVTGSIPKNSKAGSEDVFNSYGDIVVDGIELNLSIENFSADYSEA